jgi:hypothetical protein
MPKVPRDSTSRRHCLVDIINSYSKTIPTKCLSYKKYNRTYRVYIRSSRYGKCNRYSLRYNIRVTENEWQRLKKARESLL